MREIDISEWAMFGGGSEADAYNCIGDPTVMLKLYHPGTGTESADAYLRIAKELRRLGFRTPDVLEEVTFEGRQGLIFERLQNKKSLNRIMADDGTRIAECAEIFAGTLRQIHGTRVDTSVFPSRMKYVAGIIEKAHQSDLITETQYESILSSMAHTDTDTAVFGDANSSNVVISNGEPYIIDIGTFSHGAPAYDMGMFFASTAGAVDPDYFEYYGHITFEQAKEFYQRAIRCYLGTESDSEVRDYEESVRIFGAFTPIVMKLYLGESSGTDEKIELFAGR